MDDMLYSLKPYPHSNIRCFPKNSSPMNCAFILKEHIRENKDQNRTVSLPVRYAKDAFDVVNHASLMWKLSYILVLKE